jgi:hypothetical protein
MLHWSCIRFDINLLVGSDKRLSSRRYWDVLVLRLLRVGGGNWVDWALPNVVLL